MKEFFKKPYILYIGNDYSCEFNLQVQHLVY